MSKPAEYKTEAIVLKWVKLRESDCIIKMVDSSGALLEGVARGVRKPKNSSSSKLEQLNCVEVFMAKGKGLDVIKDCRLIQRYERLREDPSKFSCASCLSELLCKSLQKDVDVAKIYDMTRAFLERISNLSGFALQTLTAAALLKASSYLGFMPSFHTCVNCGIPVKDFSSCSFNFSEGGVLCAKCKTFAARDYLSVQTIEYAYDLLYLRFEEIASLNIEDKQAPDLLRFAQTWIKVQTGINLRSLPLAIELCTC